MDEVVDTYELSPMQQGMLFHAVSGSDSGVDIEQIAVTLAEPLDVALFRETWHRILERHSILRTRFRWQDVAEPRQEVVAHAALPIALADWSDQPFEVAEKRFAAHQSADRRIDFDLSRAPMMRLFAARLPGGEWRILWTFHHALLDGRSFAIVLHEWFALYDASQQGSDATLAIARPYREYIEWRRSLDFTATEAFWRESLKGFHAPTSFAIDAARSSADESVAEPYGARQRQLSGDLVMRVRAAAKRANVTINTMLQAAWAILLHRYSGESDVVFGATRAGRSTGFADADEMVGLFINTLPLRVRIDGETAIVPWLRDLRAQQIAMRAHEHAPLAAVQAWSAVARGKPLFESALVYDHLTLDARMRGPETGRRFEYIGQTNFPLTLIAYGGDEMLLRIEYSRRRFADVSIERMLEHLITLLGGLSDVSIARIGELALIGETERTQLIGGPIASYALDDASLHAGFERQVAKTPNAIAVIFEGPGGRIELTYAELDRRANALAEYLRAQGVARNELVGLRTERNAELVVAILGILKAGAAYLPLDPVYPTERIAFMLRDAGVRIVLTQRSLAAELGELAVMCVCLDEPLPAAPAAPPPLAGSIDDLAYVIYTSGSTGQPKGVRISHRNVLRLFAATDAWFGFGPDDGWTLFHSYAFDFSVWELWGALLYGGRVIVVPQEISRDPVAFRELLIAERITVLNQTPTAFRQLVDLERALSPGAFALRYVIFGGEALELQSLKPWLDRYGEDAPRLVNMYGITETTVHVTYRPITRADLEAATGSVIGVPIPDLRVYLLDAHGQPVPIGVPGEMHVAGAGVAAGYLNRPELTAQRFVPDPFQGGAARMYRSGDLARRRESGELEYLGRIDLQVKIRGFRIELGEIETVLATHPKLRQVAVIDREDVAGEKRLVAYLVAATPDPTLIAELRETLRQRLPDYMTPAQFVFLDVLPLTPNGKLDRKALPVPESVRVESGKPYRAPRNATEEAIAAVWAAVLRVERVGIDDHFFELGGDSILSIQVIARCHQRGIRLTPKHLFEHPTVAELANVVTVAAAAQPAETESVGGIVPLTPIQTWFFEQRFEDAHHWNQAFMFEVAADFDTAAFERAFRTVLRHHDALRLRYTEGAGGVTQRYVDAAPIEVEHVELADLAATEHAQAIIAYATRTQQRLDLADGPLLRGVHFALGAGVRGRVLLVVHHLIVDGVSWRILREDLETAYLAERLGKAPKLAHKTASMRRWAERSNEFAQSAEVRDALPHWRAIASVPPARLLADAPAGSAPQLARVTANLSEPETRALLQRLPKTFRTQINDVLLGALALALRRQIGGEEFRIDLEGHGREHIADDIDVSRTLGWFTTLFPIALGIRTDGDAIAALLAVRDGLRAIPHRGMSYGLLRYASRDASIRESLASAEPSSILFNYLGQFDAVVADSEVFTFAAESTGPWRSPRARRTHAIEIVGIVRDARLEIEWHYDTSLHLPRTIERAAADMLQALKTLLAAAESTQAVRFTPADFPLAALDQDALTRLLARAPLAEDIYPLTPMQRLFFAMESSASNLGFEQWQFRIDGTLDPTMLRKAIGHAIERHTILRTAFIDQGGAQPLQIVVSSATLPWIEEDLRSLSSSEQESHLDALLAADESVAFDLAAPPAMRIALRRLGDASWHMSWSTHHLCIDGWSWPIVFRDVSRAYAAFAAGAEPSMEPAIPYRRYVEWLAHSAPRSDEFWRERLRNFAPTPMRLGLRPAQAVATHGPPRAHFEETTIVVAAETATALRNLARREQVTPSVLMNAAWSLVLSHYAASGDVVFGASFSGRPAEMRGIESLVGPCVNNLPVRTAVPDQAPLATWLAELRQAQFDLAQHQYTPLEQIQQWADIPLRYRMFESLLVFQNYRVDDEARRIGDATELTLIAAPEATNYPLTIAVTMADEMRIRLIHQAATLDAADVGQFAADLGTILQAMPDAHDVKSLHALLSPALRGRANAIIARAPARSSDYAAPTSDFERSIAEVWRALFGVERISLDDNFFELGGHSLLLVRAHAQLKEKLTTDLPIVALLQFPTVRSLARHLAGSRSTAPASDAAIDRARKQREAFARQRNLTGKR